ncbi:hypothetical protein ACFOY8_15185 [Thalassospira xianhensis]|uniref:Uncharacterized protein n=1 Tax=Thalassospira xianhensis MCCC 1A02616 TaxID=1177929 RepID=A0A367UGS9_9PROT|nr:hypothetical protein [Thalassospira xianhensis]RCK07515.1 hypothetical protein TH5_00035 [Thalassospira xianhensis MCCC 1A02616]
MKYPIANVVRRSAGTPSGRDLAISSKTIFWFRRVHAAVHIAHGNETIGEPVHLVDEETFMDALDAARAEAERLVEKYSVDIRSSLVIYIDAVVKDEPFVAAGDLAKPDGENLHFPFFLCPDRWLTIEDEVRLSQNVSERMRVWTSAALSTANDVRVEAIQRKLLKVAPQSLSQQEVQEAA